MPERSNIYPVLLCGGSGTRLWPLSRRSYPKQFARITGEASLFQSSVSRFDSDGFQPPIVITGDPFRFIVTEQMAAMEISPLSILIEPEGKNTAPAVLATALWLERYDPDAMMIVAPSDHVMTDPAGFREAVFAAASAAEEGHLVLFGITPTRPETGYGYLELGPGGQLQSVTPQPLHRFVEKPDTDGAERMLASGKCLWNAGLFMFSVKTIVEAFRAHVPAMVEPVQSAVQKASADLGFTRLEPESWSRVEDISIDYAIMEKAQGLMAVPYSGGWSDLGGWQAVWQELGPDDAGNVTAGNASAIDCENVLLRSEAEGLELVGIGLEDIVAIAMPDAVLVARKSDDQRVKEAVAVLKAKNASQAVQSARDHRPWGWFESLALSDRFQVKRIVVNPGAALSLQSHKYRAEHWIVVAGTARVTIDDKVMDVDENQSVYIPRGAIHRMENRGSVPMVLIEVQTGSYFGEDDIVRYQDVYART